VHAAMCFLADALPLRESVRRSSCPTPGSIFHGSDVMGRLNRRIGKLKKLISPRG
jgi:hypothetical protein